MLDGLAENSKVVMNPTDDLGEGVQVQVQVQVKPFEQPKGGSSGQSARH
jgi:hypothetical protein